MLVRAFAAVGWQWGGRWAGRPTTSTSPSAGPSGSAFPRNPAYYTESVLTRLSVKAAPITTRAADYGPMVPACCNVCRTCTTTNIVGVATAGFFATFAAVRRLVKR